MTRQAKRNEAHFEMNRLVTENIRIGGRASDLAQIQAKQVGSAIQEIFPNIQISYSFFKSQGDVDLQTPIYRMQSKGVFTRDLTNRLLNGQADVIIHSHKDLELDNHPQTKIISVLKRADPRDILLIKKEFLKPLRKFNHLTVYTSSLRRAYNIEHIHQTLFPKSLRKLHLDIQPIRGNVSTRLHKIQRESEPSVLICAKAAVDRLLGNSSREFVEVTAEMRYIMDNMAFMILPLSLYPTAACQGALAAEVLANNKRLVNIMNALSDQDTQKCVAKERKNLAQFGGGCQQEMGITCLQMEYGIITYMRGRTQEKKEIGQCNLQSVKNLASIDRKQAFPLPEDKYDQKIVRNDLRMQNESLPKNLYVSRIEALPSSWLKKIQENQDTIICCAGTTTAQKLADQNIWVHANSDSLGEKEIPDLKFILNKKISFVKLTHKTSFKRPSSMHIITSYQLSFTIDPKIASTRKNFFWKSPSHFEHHRNYIPTGHDITHSCGAGMTAHYLKTEYGINPYIFLCYADWLSHLENRQNPLQIDVL